MTIRMKRDVRYALHGFYACVVVKFETNTSFTGFILKVSKPEDFFLTSLSFLEIFQSFLQILGGCMMNGAVPKMGVVNIVCMQLLVCMACSRTK